MPKREREPSNSRADRENIIYHKLNLQGWCLKLHTTFQTYDHLEALMDDIKQQYDAYRNQKEECRLLLQQNPDDNSLRRRMEGAATGIQELTERLYETERRFTAADRQINEIKNVIREVYGIDPYRGIGV